MHEDGQSLRFAWRNNRFACLLLACAALALIGVWLDTSGRGGVLAETYSGLNQTVVYGCRLLSLVLMALLYHPVFRNMRRISLAGGACMVGGTVLLVVANYERGALAEAIFLAGHALCGMGYLPCILPLYFALGYAFNLKWALTATLAALAAKRQIPALIAALPAYVRLWALLAVTLLLACVLVGFWSRWRLLFGATTRPRKTALAENAGRYTMLLGIVANLSLFVFGIVSSIGFVHGSASSATGAAILELPGKLASLAVLVGFGYLAVIRRIDRPIVWRFIPAFAILALSTVLVEIAVLSGEHVVTRLIGALLIGIYDFNQLLVWAFVVCTAQGRNACALRRAVAITFAYSFLAAVGGSVEVDVFSAWGSNVVVTFGLVVIMIVAVALPARALRQTCPAPAERDPAREEMPAAADGAGALDAPDSETKARLEAAMAERCAYLAQAFNLTTREAEVFHLLCRGRGRAAICEELCMSEGTVKTHIAHIYEKTGVNTRQALSEIAFSGPGVAGVAE